MSTSLSHVASELQRSCGVWASCEESVREAVATDFGGLTRKLPAVVVRPADAAQVAGVLRYAYRHGLPVSVRAAAHSIGGQTLNDDGILLETSRLSRVSTPNVAQSCIEVEAGAKWSTVVSTALEYGFVPPVLTGTLGTTVGGTHSVGGLGHASHLHGAQVDNCLGMEVVTAQGEICWCDAEVRPELFEHVLGGLGQLAVITRVRHRLRRHGPFVRRWRFFYCQLSDMLRDLEALAAAGVAHYLSGYGFAVDGRFGYCIEAGVEMDDDLVPDREAALGVIAPDTVRGPIVQRFAEFVTQHAIAPIADDRAARMPERGKINPWIDLLAPAAQVRSVFDGVLRCFPAPLRRNATMLFWPLFRQRFTRPLFMVPDAERIILAGLYLTVDSTERPAALTALSAATERIAAAGGKRYVYAWMPFDAAGWAQHYGARWSALCRLKAEYDPQMILGCDIIQYGAARAAARTAAAVA